jgi:NAD(P) transhydrogenase subunit alpha
MIGVCLDPPTASSAAAARFADFSATLFHSKDLLMRLGVPRQQTPGETRVSLTPAAAKRIVAMDVEVVVEAGAGRAAGALDEAYETAGARVVPSPGEPPTDIWTADVVVTLSPPSVREYDLMKPGAVLVGMLAPLQNRGLVQALAERKITAISLDFVPRISRAQSMDVLSSQANVAGYKAVLMAADHCPKMFPMMITAAGTLAPAKVVVLGVGVAGLQAIATAKRLGAVVEANDVRAATREQVQSLGARFIELPDFRGQDDAASGGYAKELTDEQKKQQQELVGRHVAAADAVIATAAIFGKAPPLLIPADVVHRMAPGSVIVDLAASVEHGRGNCELTRPGETITTEGGVKIVGSTNVPALVPVHASQVYANNMYALLKEIVVEGAVKIDLADDIQKGAVITHDGQVVNEMVRNAT